MTKPQPQPLRTGPRPQDRPLVTARRSTSAERRVMPDKEIAPLAADAGIGQLEAYASARAHLVALADAATTFEATSAYEITLIELDRIHSPIGPIIDVGAVADTERLMWVHARDAIQRLSPYIDPLDLELVLALLSLARPVREEEAPDGPHI